MISTLAGCKSAAQHRKDADKVATQIIQQDMQAIGRNAPFSIERPSDILRRRLLSQQNLPIAGPSSLGTDQLEPIEHWPEEDYPDAQPSLDPIVVLEGPDEPVKITLMQALEIGAQNNFDYQTAKEDIFRQALNLDLEQNEFRTIFNSQVQSLVQADTIDGQTVSGTENAAVLGVSKKFPSGIEVTGDIAASLANLLTLNHASALGISADASVSVPLLRGSGRHIVTEPLIQAQRNVIYSIYLFERFRKTYAVSIASGYLNVLRQLDIVENNKENYSGLIRSARRARRLADAGRLTEVQVDQAVQEELRARNNWISATENYKSRLDAFKNLLGLPTDALIELDRSELQQLDVYSKKFTIDTNEIADSNSGQVLPAGAPVVLRPPDMNNVGSLEINEDDAFKLAFENRFDLKVAQGRVYDAQRAIVVLADALRAELTLLGTAQFGGNRTLNSVNSDDIMLGDRSTYTALMNLDLPLERTAERDAYRNGYITLERAVRDVQSLEDEIKIDIRNNLRDLLESRESLLIQAQSVKLAEKRVKSTNLFLEAGRAEIRDLLDSQESLLNAQNSLTAAIINYRVAELQLQSDMGVLEITDNGFWKEYSPGEK